MRFQGEVAGVEEADNRTRIVPLERLRAWRQEKWVVLTPHSQEGWLVGPEIFLEGRRPRPPLLPVRVQLTARQGHLMGGTERDGGFAVNCRTGAVYHFTVCR